jgi:hypothetical protein
MAQGEWKDEKNNGNLYGNDNDFGNERRNPGHMGNFCDSRRK